MIEQIPITRGGKEYVLFIGKDDTTGQAVDYINQVLPDEETGWPVRFEPVETTIKRGTQGSVAYILNHYRRVLLDLNGKVVPDTEKRFMPGVGSLTVLVNPQDTQYFIDVYGEGIMKSTNNGVFRGMFGYNAYPVFDDAGAVITYTPEQEATPPTFDYHPAPTEPAQ